MNRRSFLLPLLASIAVQTVLCRPQDYPDLPVATESDYYAQVGDYDYAPDYQQQSFVQDPVATTVKSLPVEGGLDYAYESRQQVDYPNAYEDSFAPVQQQPEPQQYDSAYDDSFAPVVEEAQQPDYGNVYENTPVIEQQYDTIPEPVQPDYAAGNDEPLAVSEDADDAHYDMVEDMEYHVEEQPQQVIEEEEDEEEVEANLSEEDYNDQPLPQESLPAARPPQKGTRIPPICSNGADARCGIFCKDESGPPCAVGNEPPCACSDGSRPQERKGRLFF